MLQASGSDSCVFVVSPNFAGSEYKAMYLSVLRDHDKGKMPLCRLRVPLCGHDGHG